MELSPGACGATREDVRLALEQENIEARPVWKPMHMQPVFANCRAVGGSVSEEFFANGICLPSGSNLSYADVDRVCEVVHRVHASARGRGAATAGDRRLRVV